MAGRKPRDYRDLILPGGHAVAPTADRKAGSVLWVAECECGTRYETAAFKRTTWHCQDCANRARTAPTLPPGMTQSAIYRTWCDMKSRCYNPSVRSFKTYGARGIRVCESWRNSFEEYRAAVEKLGPRPSPQHTVDRIDNDGHYEPGNIRWADKLTQTRNRTLG